MASSKQLRAGFDKLLAQFGSTGIIAEPYGGSFMTHAMQDDLEGFQEWEIERYDAESGPAYRDHLALIYIPEHGSVKLRKALKDTFPTLVNILDLKSSHGFGNNHNPDFLILNFTTNQMIAAGLSRKNGTFIVDALGGDIIPTTFFLRKDFTAGRSLQDDFIISFTSQDVAKVTFKIIEALSLYGSATYDYFSDLGDPDENQETRDDSKFTLSCFLPDIDFNELNTGDF